MHSVEHLHLLIEMSKLAYADRDRWIGDPAKVEVPVAALLAKAYAAERRQAFDRRKAHAYAAGDPEGDTTGFVVADGRGNVISVIQSLFNSFGSGVVPPGTGRAPAQPRPPLHHANRRIPAPWPRASVPSTRSWRPSSPGTSGPWSGFATMGGNGQAMFHLQVLTNLLDYGMDPQEAIERPALPHRGLPSRRALGRHAPGGPGGAAGVHRPASAADTACAWRRISRIGWATRTRSPSATAP